MLIDLFHLQDWCRFSSFIGVSEALFHSLKSPSLSFPVTPYSDICFSLRSTMFDKFSLAPVEG